MKLPLFHVNEIKGRFYPRILNNRSRRAVGAVDQDGGSIAITALQPGKEERREREDRFISGVDSFCPGYQCPITVSKNQQTANVTQPLIDRSRSHPVESSTKDCRASGWNLFRNYLGIGWCVLHLSTAGGRSRFHSRHNPPPTDLARQRGCLHN